MSTPGWLFVLVMRKQIVYTLTSAEEALDLLISDWPVHDGTPFIDAMEACEGVIKGTVTSEVAQFAFLTAAMDAGVDFKFPEPQSEPRLGL